MIEKVISGGQTGADRAALDVAMRIGIPVGGWCPRGRWAEDGPIDDRYPLTETVSTDPSDRTLLNVRDADGTLVIAPYVRSPGTNLTIAEAQRVGKPVFQCDPTDSQAPEKAFDWVIRTGIHVLNVAGPRASELPAVYGLTARFLLEFFRLSRDADSDEEPGEDRSGG